MSVAIRGTGFNRTITSGSTGALVVPIRSLTPALPTSLANGAATVTIDSCSEAPNPNQRRNWR